MLEKFINEVSKPIIENKGKTFNKELQELFSEKLNRQKLGEFAKKYQINYQIIEADFMKAFENEEEFDKHLQQFAKIYDTYYKLRENQKTDLRFLDFRDTFTILHKNLAKLEDIMDDTNVKINNILLRNPGIENNRKIFNAILEKDKYVILSPEEKDAKKAEFLSKVQQLVKEEANDKEIRSTFRDIFQIQSKKLSKEHRKRLYEYLELPAEFLGYITTIDRDIIKTLLDIHKTSKEGEKKATTEHLINLLREHKDIPEEAFTNFTVKAVGQGIKVVGKIDLSQILGSSKKIEPKKMVEEKQLATTNPLEIVGNKMTEKEFLANFNIANDNGIFDSTKIEKFIKNTKEIPARCNNYAQGAYYFTIGKENRGFDTPSISVKINRTDIPKEIHIENGKVYKIRITKIFKSNAAENNTKKQSYNMNGIVIDDKYQEE